MPSLAQQILDYAGREGYRPEKPKSLAKKLGVTKKRLTEFETALDGLVSEGRLRLLDSGRVALSVPAGFVLGVIQRTTTGAGYLIPHEPRPAKLIGDVYIDPHDMRDAQRGDEVLVKLISRRRSGGQRCGIVVDIVQRATNVFVGTYFVEGDSGWVNIDGKYFNEPVWVGDPGAKGAREGDKVVIEMLRFPAFGQTGEAVLTEVLGPRGKPGVDTLTVIHEFGLPHVFSEEVLADARLEAENFRPDDLEGRDDLTQETIVTIDPVDARDFDDAISLQRTPDGHWHLGVHIADVSHFVQPGTPLDQEAEKRGTSVYLPTMVIPMLPEVISNGLASLQEQKVRFTKSAFIEFNPEGIPVGTSFANTVICVTARFAYEEVLPLIESDPPSTRPDKSSSSADRQLKKKRSTPSSITPEVHQLLRDMHELAMILRRRRFSQGALNMDMPEIKLDFDEEGRVVGAHERVHDESHQIIEEFMLAANIAVATELDRRGLAFLRRVHGEPNPIKLKAFAEFVQSLGFELKQPQSRPHLQRLLQHVKGLPEERAVNYALLRSMKQAEYSPLDVGHYALAEDNYCHFTSPIRRYPDLLVHRLLDAILLSRKTHAGGGEENLVRLGRHCSATERRAEKAERELIKIKLLSYLETRIGEELEAVITGVDRFGFYCRGIEIPAEGLVHLSTLQHQETFDFDRDIMTLVGRRSGVRFRLGDRVRVKVALVDIDRRELDLHFVGFSEQSGPQRGQKVKGKSHSKQKRKKSSERAGGKSDARAKAPRRSQRRSR